MAPRHFTSTLRPRHFESAASTFLQLGRREMRISSPQKTVAPIVNSPSLPSPFPPGSLRPPPLSILPLSNVFRTYFVTTMSSSRLVLETSLALLKRVLASKSPLLNVEKNPALRGLLMNTFYSQFCGGENPQQVEKTLQSVKSLGYQGVILEYCLEVLETESSESTGYDLSTLREIAAWKSGMVQSIAMAHPQDFVALKWSGMGNFALKLLKNDLPPTPAMQEAMDEVCDFAYQKNVRLLPGAEWEQTNKGIDSWTLELMTRYNRSSEKGAILFNTYQAYLKSTPAKLANHLAYASEKGFIPGVKLVRGAYLSTEPRSSIWATKEETDQTYDSIMEGVMRRQYSGLFTPTGEGAKLPFPPRLELLIATHNHQSVSKAQEIRREQVQAGEPLVPLSFAQLQGMADDVSCELAQDRKKLNAGQAVVLSELGGAYKSVAWGTLSECLHYLLRRASENKDAVSRTADTRKAMGRELRRRLRSLIGLA